MTSAPSTPTGKPTSTSPTSLPALDLYDTGWPIWTYGEITPPAKFIHNEDNRRGIAVSSLVSGGCIISGTSIHRSLLFTGVYTHSYANVEASVLLPYATVGRERAAARRGRRPRREHSRGPRRRR